MDRIKVGDYAPDFLLKDNRGEEIRLTDYKGKKVLLSWHPLAWTSVCAEQMKALEANLAEFESNNTVPLGLSIDSYPCKNAWAKELGIATVKLLADFWPHGEIAQKYGLFRQQEGFSERANVLVGEDGKVLWVKIYPIPELPDIAEVLEQVKKA
ncbi:MULTISPECIES: peroxiredoxin [Sporomusa]|uniref:Peroxiredoxin/MT2298 n=2 Tax=Sporomusa TaxID=2375 RepID=A0ABM9W9V6_9FIRM|nr:peroxiredoxin [Sporomusa sphaeroides]OLS57554.1 putative peroxiredoxinc [Sporomusa sphaeroides DSM 2875]CVK20750.1 Putative peroxiredoxin/MT2298 [Sporomusa sphaeroides DSM 2875]SCM81096.1 putative thioredoxin peroxidase [uncultured Sporomusa sp.]HML34554.1 peroxiredoxin [Sporomusa sphaeroides]